MQYDREGMPIRKPMPNFEEQQPEVDTSQIAQEFIQESGHTINDFPKEEFEDEQVYHNNSTDNDLVENQKQAQEQGLEEENRTKTITQNAVQESFKALREQKEQAQREMAEFKRLYEEEKARKEEEQEQEIDINDDDLVEGKTLKQYAAKIKKLENNIKESNKQSEQIRQQQALNAIDMRIKNQFPDFDKVVSSHTIEIMNKNYPELAMSLSANNDIYSKAVSAYTMIKNLGIYKEDNFVADKIRAQQNAAKPKNSASLSPQKGETPLSKANEFERGELTPELKAKMLKEMQSARRNY